MATVAGVDGMPGGWLIALIEADGSVRWATATDARGVLRATAACGAVGVDIPMGVPDTGLRGCDLRARERLDSARSAVFFAPVRAVLAESGYDDACATSRRITGHAISRQTWGIVPKIRQWDDLLLAGTADQARIVEVHPELSFRAMAPAMTFATKRTARGAGQRLMAMRRFVDAPRVLAEAPTEPRLDDALDALAAAWSARRWTLRRAEVLGGERDGRGVCMQIVV